VCPPSPWKVKYKKKNKGKENKEYSLKGKEEKQ
jgi:hypothetical protein